MNQVNLIGRIAHDLDELGQTQGGHAYLRFRLAVNRNRTDAQGNRQADFINCVAWNKTAQNMAKYLKKGSLIGVSGNIQTGDYTKNDGTKVYTTDVVAWNVFFLESADKNKNAPQNQQGFSYNQGALSQQASGLQISDEDLPF